MGTARLCRRSLLADAIHNLHRVPQRLLKGFAGKHQSSCKTIAPFGMLSWSDILLHQQYSQTMNRLDSSDDDGSQPDPRLEVGNAPLPPEPVLRPRLRPNLQKRWPLFRATMDGVLELAGEEIGERFNVGAVTASQLFVERLVDSPLFLWSVPLRL